MPLETDKQGGIRFSLGEEIKTGLFPDIYPNLIPLWEDGDNVRFTDVGVKKAGAYETKLTTGTSSPIRGVLQAIESTTPVAYFGDLTKIYRGDLVGETVAEKGTGYALLNNAGASEWDAGSTTWDSDTTFWDFGINDAEHWSFVNYGSFILATAGTTDGPLIKKTTGSFCEMYQGVVGLDISSGGTGYVVDDVLTFTGGDGSGATCTVVTVAGGVITAAEMTAAGSGYTVAPTGVSGGTGSGATITGQITDIDVTSVKVWLTSGPHVLGFNTSNSSKEFIWCDADDVDTWVTTASNLAGALQIRELKSGITAAVPLGSRIAVYGDDQMILVNYLANALVFGYSPALDGIGAVSPRSVVPVGSVNYGLSVQGFFATDGASIQWIDRGRVRHWFESNVNLQQVSKCVAYHDEESRQVVWSFPTVGAVQDSAVVFNYEMDTWSFYSKGVTAAQERTAAPYPVTGTSGGEIHYEGSGNNADGSAITAYVRTKPIDLGSPDRIKELSSLRIGYRGDGLQYRIGWSETEDGSITWGSYADVSSGYDFHNIRTAGRYLFMEFYSSTGNIDWELMSIDIQGRVEGTR